MGKQCKAELEVKNEQMDSAEEMPLPGEATVVTVLFVLVVFL